MIWTQICEHNQITIREGERTGNCKSCDKHVNPAFFVPDTTERFNLGLGCMTSGTRDAEKKARARGLTPIGDAKITDVFRSEKRDTITPILQEARKKMHQLGEI